MHAVVGKLGPTRSTECGLMAILGPARSTGLRSQELRPARTTKKIIIAVHAAARPTEHRSRSPHIPASVVPLELVR